jgi:hypothetical protein
MPQPTSTAINKLVNKSLAVISRPFKTSLTTSYATNVSPYKMPPKRTGCLLSASLKPISNHVERAANARAFEIFSGARGVPCDLPLQLLDRGEAPLVAQAVQEADAHHVAV